jgi:hypothetical protein
MEMKEAGTYCAPIEVNDVIWYYIKTILFAGTSFTRQHPLPQILDTRPNY